MLCEIMMWHEYHNDCHICATMSILLCERYVKIIHMCNNDYERLWKVPSRGKHWGLCCFLWEGSTDLGEKQMLVLFGNLFGNNSNWEGGEQTLCWRDWRATTKYNRDHFMSKKSCPAENLRNHFAAKSIWQTQTFPEGSLHCIGSKVLVLSSLLVFAHFFFKFTFCFYQVW